MMRKNWPGEVIWMSVPGNLPQSLGVTKKVAVFYNIEKKLNLTGTERLGVIVRCDWKRRQQLGGGVQVL